ncbi:DUF2637 domain-containing protein [Dactylosporangium sp. NPDC051485]|uniref:DUF2637 domain-containing protein n=1 Tax=Dactylosporangium sp. NPDC051485 TaxID=3154846 RepID=UPI0034190B46
MLAIGGAAGAASFTHVHDVAAAHGQPGWLAWTDAVTLELASIAAGLDLRRRKRIGKSVRFPAAVLTVAVILSLSAQVVEAEPSVIGWLAAALPALGFLAMVKMAMGRADTGPAVPPGGPPVPDETATVADETAMVPDGPVPDRGEPGSVQDGPGPSRPSVDVTALVPAATLAARSLAAQGIPVNRDTLARQMRADGHPPVDRYRHRPDEAAARPAAHRPGRRARRCADRRRQPLVTDTSASIRSAIPLPGKENLLEHTLDSPPMLTLRKDTPTMNTLLPTAPNRTPAAASVSAMPLLDGNDTRRYGTCGRSRVGVWVGSRVSLDTDPQTDPLNRPTGQVSAANSNPCSTPTDPSRGLPHGGIYA